MFFSHDSRPFCERTGKLVCFSPWIRRAYTLDKKTDNIKRAGTPKNTHLELPNNLFLFSFFFILIFFLFAWLFEDSSASFFFVYKLFSLQPSCRENRAGNLWYNWWRSKKGRLAKYIYSVRITSWIMNEHREDEGRENFLSLLK